VSNQAQRVWRILGVVAALVNLAVVLRLPGFDGRALWVDELWRVNLILDEGSFARYWRSPDVYTAITAPAYLLINTLLGWWSASPSVLRLSSLLPALISVVMAFGMAWRASTSILWATCAGLLMATNANFIQYANEFKPYMFEVMVHLVCMYLWFGLLLAGKATQRQWLVFGGALAIGALSAANTVFILPAMGVSLFMKVWLRDRTSLQNLIAVFTGVGVLVGALYVLVWSFGSNKELISYWADGFHDATREGYLAFVGTRLSDIWNGAFAALNAQPRMVSLSVLALAYAFYSLLTRRVSDSGPAQGVMIFGTTLLVTMLALNKMSLWPIGEIRPNMFLYALVAMSWFLFVGTVLPRKALYVAGALALAVMASGLLKADNKQLAEFGPPPEQSDRVWAAFLNEAPAGRMLQQQCNGQPVVVFVDPAMSSAIQYYASHPSVAVGASVLARDCARRIGVPDAYAAPQALSQRITDNRVAGATHWHLYSHLTAEEVDKLKKLAAHFGSIAYEASFEGAGYFAVTPGKDVPHE
jgi:hypothetical protein